MDASEPVHVAVVGTLNMDVIVGVERMPDVGETVMGRSMSERPGGKGGNQALASATVTRTALIAAAGRDDAGTRLVENQRTGGVDTSYVLRAEGRSGQAIIEVDDAGDNRIVVLSGANALLTGADTLRGLDSLQPSIVLTQLESPPEVTVAVAEWCAGNGKRLLLNPSPVTELDDRVLATADPLVVNEGEAAFYAQASPDDDPMDLARRLLAVSRSIVITLGADGVVAATHDAMRRIDVARVDAVDTTGAGDLFAGSLAGHLARGVDFFDAAGQSAGAATDFVSRPRGQ